MKNDKVIYDLPLKKTAMCLALSAQALYAVPALAAPSDAEVQELRAMIDKLQKKIDNIESAQNKAAPAVASSGTLTAQAKAGNLLPQGLTIYGALDSGVEMVTNVGSVKETLTRIPSTTGYGPSIVGLDFRRNVSDSIAVVGKAEMGIYLDTGASGQGSRLFGRQAYIGIDSQVGSLTFGRQYSMLFYSLHGADILGPNIHGIGSIDAYIPNARADNSVVWRAKFEKLSLGAHYSFGRDTVSGTVPASGSCAGEDAADTSRCHGWSAMAKYDDPHFGVAVAIDNQYGGTGAQASFFNGAGPISLIAGSDEDRRVTANGYFRFGALKLGAGWLGRKVTTKLSNVTQDITWLEGEYVLTPKVVVDGGIFHVENNAQERKANLYVIRGTYKFDDQFSTYLSLGFVDNNATAAYGVSSGGAGASPAVGNAQFGAMTGVRYRF